MNSFHTYAFPNAKSIIVCGDIHGEFNAVIYKLCIQYQMTELQPETIQAVSYTHLTLPTKLEV